MFLKYRNAPFYSDIQEHMMTAESEILLLVNRYEFIPRDPEKEDSEDIKLESPVIRWKQLLGNMNPETARNEDPDSLRAKFGADLIRNAFHGADDERAANKERDVFLFPIPERIPEFEYVRTKIDLDLVLKWLFPPNLEHANSTGRLDLLAMYGPIVNHHSVDYCFCPKC